MCTRFVYNGSDIIVGFNFDIDLAVWTHTIVKEKDKFYIGIKMPDGNYHSFHGINKNGNVGTLLYVNGNEKGKRILKSVKQEGLWVTRVSFVYSVRENKVCYVLNNDFEHILKYQLEKDHNRSSISKKKVKEQEM